MVLQVTALWLFGHHVRIVLHSLGQCGVVTSVWCSDCCTSCSLCRLLWGDTVDGGAPDGEPHQPKHVEVDVHTVHCVHVWWRIWLLGRLGVVRDGVCPSLSLSLSVCLSVSLSVCLSVSWFAATASDNEVYSCPTSCCPQRSIQSCTTTSLWTPIPSSPIQSMWRWWLPCANRCVHGSHFIASRNGKAETFVDYK